MICTVLADTDKIKYFYEKRDCHLWQPLIKITDEISEYVEKTKDTGLRLERFASYFLLFNAVKEVFGAKILRIERSSHGKPYIAAFSSLASFENAKTNEKFNSGEKNWSYEAKKSDRENWCFEEKASDREEMRIEKISLDREERREEEISKNEERKIFFSLSHSGGLCAITLSDECEVGVDIQSAPGRDTVERLQKKYFENASFAPENIKNILLEAKIDGEKICFNEVSALALKAADSKAGSAFSDIASDDLLTRKFLESWVITEAILKCDGRGFSAMDQIEKLKSTIIYDVNSFVYNEKIFSISAAKVKSM